MLRRYWRLIATVGFLTLWPDAAIAQDIGNQPPADASARQAATEAADDVGKAGPTWGQFIAFTGEQHSGDDCDDACQRDKADLQAQQDMANAAWAMVLATFIGVLVGIGSLVLIWRTVEHTKTAAIAAGAAVTEAKKATTAAEAAVAETRRIGEAQARAYVTPTSCAMFHVIVGKKPYARVGFSNSGMTPASKVTVRGSIVVAVYPQDKGHGQGLTSQNRHTSGLAGSSGPVSVDVKRFKEFTEEERVSIEAGTHALYIYVVIEYFDVFGAFNRSRTTFVYSELNSTHNNADRAPYGNAFEWGIDPKDKRVPTEERDAS